MSEQPNQNPEPTGEPEAIVVCHPKGDVRVSREQAQAVANFLWSLVRECRVVGDRRQAFAAMLVVAQSALDGDLCDPAASLLEPGDPMDEPSDDGE